MQLLFEMVTTLTGRIVRDFCSLQCCQEKSVCYQTTVSLRNKLFNATHRFHAYYPFSPNDLVTLPQYEPGLLVIFYPLIREVKDEKSLNKPEVMS